MNKEIIKNYNREENQLKTLNKKFEEFEINSGKEVKELLNNSKYMKNTLIIVINEDELEKYIDFELILKEIQNDIYFDIKEGYNAELLIVSGYEYYNTNIKNALYLKSDILNNLECKRDCYTNEPFYLRKSLDKILNKVRTELKKIIADDIITFIKNNPTKEKEIRDKLCIFESYQFKFRFTKEQKEILRNLLYKPIDSKNTFAKWYDVYLYDFE